MVKLLNSNTNLSNLKERNNIGIYMITKLFSVKLTCCKGTSHPDNFLSSVNCFHFRANAHKHMHILQWQSIFWKKFEYFCSHFSHDDALSWNCHRVSCLNPYPLGILARNFPDSSKILQCTFGNMPLSSKWTMHYRWAFIFSTYGLYFLPGSNFAPFEEVKVPVSNSAEFFKKSAPWRIWGGWVRILIQRK